MIEATIDGNSKGGIRDTRNLMMANDQSFSFNSDDSFKIFPPLRFGKISSVIYRGAYPNLQNFRFLQRLNLKIMISMTPEVPNPDLMKFAESHNIEIIHYQIFQNAPLNGNLLELLLQALQVSIVEFI